ncbi:MAG TPA: sugar phosphate isomerase/epimerase [Tepidisphaeraceae bacterium]|nr:sugar phosphate isomerase/epimerase [Tepidisphaeraceae bacterium]
MINLAFSTNAFKKNTLDEAIDAIATIGYRGVELMADLHHAYPPAMDEQRRRHTREKIATPGLVVSNVNAFTLFACGDTYHPTWIEDDAAARRRRIDHTLASVELAAQFGAKTVSLQPGGPMIGTTLTRERAGELYAQGLAEVVPLGKKLGVILAVEPEPGLFIQTAGEYLDFKNRFFKNEDAVRMNCDIGHLFCVGDDPATVIRNLPEHVAHVHLEDIGQNRVHQHLTPGKGVIDFPAIFEALDDIDYRGWTTVELYPYETTAGGVAKLAFNHLKPMLS